MSKIEIHLSDDEQQELTRIVSSGNHPARRVRRAQILLRSSDGWTGEAIGAALGVSRQTVYTVRKQAVSDGVAEAHLVALTCREPPAGYERWTLRLLADVCRDLSRPGDHGADLLPLAQGIRWHGHGSGPAAESAGA